MACTACAGGAGAGRQRPRSLSQGLRLSIAQLPDAPAVGLAVVMDLGLGCRVQLDVADLAEGEQDFLFLFTELVLRPVIFYPFVFKAPQKSCHIHNSIFRVVVRA